MKEKLGFPQSKTISSASIKEGKRFKVLANKEDLIDENLVNMGNDQENLRRKGKEILIQKSTGTDLKGRESVNINNHFFPKESANRAILITEPNTKRPVQRKEINESAHTNDGPSKNIPKLDGLDKNVVESKQAAKIEMGNGSAVVVGLGFGMEQNLLMQNQCSSVAEKVDLDNQVAFVSSDDGGLAEVSERTGMEFEGADFSSQYAPQIIPSVVVDVTNSKSPNGIDPTKHTAVRFKLDQFLDDDGQTSGGSGVVSKKGKGKKSGLGAGILT